MKLLKILYNKVIAKLAIKELKKGIFPETSTRVIAHYSIIEMDKLGLNNLQIAYEDPETGDKLTISVIRQLKDNKLEYD